MMLGCSRDADANLFSRAGHSLLFRLMMPRHRLVKIAAILFGSMWNKEPSILARLAIWILLRDCRDLIIFTPMRNHIELNTAILPTILAYAEYYREWLILPGMPRQSRHFSSFSRAFSNTMSCSYGRKHLLKSWILHRIPIPHQHLYNDTAHDGQCNAIR